MGVGAGGELAEAGDEVFGGDHVVGLVGVGGVADVVDAFHDDEVLDAGLGEDVAIEPGECGWAGGVVEEAVAADAFIEDGEVGGLLVGLKAVREDIGPAGVCIARAEGSVSDAVAKGDDGGAFGGDFNVEAFEKGPAVDFFGGFEGFGGDDVAFDGVAGLIGEAVLRDLVDGLGGDEEGNCDVCEGREFQVGRIADGEGSGREW